MSVSQENREGLKRALDEWKSEAAGIAYNHEFADRWSASVCDWLVDASLLGDTQNLSDALEALQSIYADVFRPNNDERAEAQVDVLTEFASAALDRARQAELKEKLTSNSDSLATQILMFIHRYEGQFKFFGPSTAEIAEGVSVVETEKVSRTLQSLAERGLVSNTRHHNRDERFELRWRNTPRGEVVSQSVLYLKEEANS